jgi:hypothetical protein
MYGYRFFRECFQLISDVPCLPLFSESVLGAAVPLRHFFCPALQNFLAFWVYINIAPVLLALTRTVMYKQVNFEACLTWY